MRARIGEKTIVETMMNIATNTVPKVASIESPPVSL
jgi:hypothetical protein